MKYTLAGFTFMLVAAAAYSEDDKVQLDVTTIVGNAEQPRVTFIVPWRDVPAELPEWVLTPRAQPPLTPIDRDVMKRELELRGLVTESDSR